MFDWSWVFICINFFFPLFYKFKYLLETLHDSGSKNKAITQSLATSDFGKILFSHS